MTSLELSSVLLGNILIFLISFIVSAIPLYLAIKTLGSKTGLFKTAFIVIVSGLIVSAIRYYLNTWSGLIAFFILIWIYHESFRLGWIKAFLAWILQFVFIFVIYFIITLLSNLF